jgi:hypothetical protein
VYGVKSILTFNGQDYARFEHLAALHPSEVLLVD